jgi:hypothetical protein
VTNKADNLSNSEKLFYANEALKQVWGVIDKTGYPVNADFDWFIDQIYTDSGKNYKAEDMPPLGYVIGIYLLDHPYPNADRLKTGFQKLGQATPIGKVPSKWGLSKVVANASLYTSYWDVLTLTKEAAFDAVKDFKTIVMVAAGTYATYKIIGLVVAGIAAFTALYKLKSERK